MRCLTKKVMSLVMAIALFGAGSAMAATTPGIPSYDGTTVTVPFDTTVAATDYITILVYASTSESDLPTDTNIAFIDQVISGEAGDAIEFIMRDDFVGEDGKIKEGTYKVLMGGTGVDEMKSATLEIGEDILWGDVNSNGAIDINDGILILKKAGDPSIDVDATLSDVNDNGSVDINDGILVLKKAGDPSLVFPVEQ